MCPAVSYTAGWVKVLKPVVEAQKPHVIEAATPELSVRFESCRGHHLTSGDTTPRKVCTTSSS